MSNSQFRLDLVLDSSSRSSSALRKPPETMPVILDHKSSPTPGDIKANADIIDERRRLHHEADVVIVGAGIAGSAMAVALGKQGRSVILLERSLKEPDRIVGELLQPGGVQALRKLGLEDCLDNMDSIPVLGYKVMYYDEEVDIPYPLTEGFGKRPQGRSFHHGRFVQKLRAAAMNTPNVTVVETTVNDVVKNEWTGQILGVECKTNGQKDFYFGSLTIISDGYASKFRKLHTAQVPLVRSRFYGVELIDAQLPLPLHGHVILGDFSPVLLYQIGTHETRALIDIPDDCPTASPAAGGAKGHLQNVVLPILPDCVKPAFRKALEAGQIRSMPNSWLPPRTNRLPGMMVLGDAMNIRHPLTGGGMTVALNDVVLLAELLRPEVIPGLDDTKAVLEQMKSFHWKRKDVTSVINILAQALYSLFAADEANLKALQLGCFRYFQLGGSCVDGPVGLLAGLIRNPMVLIYHFFSVALYAIWLDSMKYNVIFLPIVLLWRGFSLIWTACVVIMPYIGAELKS